MKMQGVSRMFVRSLHSSVAGGGGRRVVVTGMGLVTCLGVGVEHVWARLVKGECGLSQLKQPGFESIPSKVVGFVPRGDGAGDLNLEKCVRKSDLRTMSTASAYALVAAEEAIATSGWVPHDKTDHDNAGVAVGMGMVCFDDIIEHGTALKSKGYRGVNPHFVPRVLINMPAGHLSLKYGLRGPNHAVSTACTTGLHAIGDASRFIQHGSADLMVCGGTESCINPLAMAGFARMRALATKFNDSPKTASRPFDKDREGFVMSEGAGILVLEELEHAKSRGANIYAEILGYGVSGDAHHISAPHTYGDGAFRCMKMALREAGVTPQEVEYINAHATSTPLGDAAETHAIKTLRLDMIEDLRVSSTKGALGHLLGAAGSVEAIFTILACSKGMVPPTVNLDNPDTEEEFDFVAHVGKEWTSQRRIALTNSFGFGGTNASVCISNFTE